MRTSIKKIPFTWIAFLFVPFLLLGNGAHENASAASWSYHFENQSSVDGYHLWIVKGKVDFEQWQLPNGWVANAQTPDYLGASGPEVPSMEGKWHVTFSDNKPFTLEWAEMLGGGIVASGQLKYNKNKGWKPSSKFTSATPRDTVPIPGTALLLGFGLISLLALKGRKNSDYS